MKLVMILVILLSLILGFFGFLEIRKKKYIHLVSIAVSLIAIIGNIFLLFYYANKDINFGDFLVGIIVGDILCVAYFLLYVICKMLRIDKYEKGYNDVVFSINNSENNIYLLLDNKDHVKEISDCLLKEFGLQKKQVLSRKIYDILDKRVRVTLVNNLPSSNKKLREEAKDYKEHYYEKKEEKKEILFQNSKGESTNLNLIVRPIVENNKYQGKVFIGNIVSTLTMTGLEKEILEKNKDIESIQSRFIATIELTKEGMFFYDLDANSYWGNDNWRNDLALHNNEISFYDFKARIHEDDIPYYLDKINKLDVDNPYYEIRYRFLINGNYHYVYEHGKRLFDETGQNIIVGFANRINDNFFEFTGHKEVDNLKKFNDLKDDLDVLLNKGFIFQLVAINLSNLPTINEQYGRNVGNIIMVEYLKRLKESFQSESSSLYRASGLLFYLTITDPRKMELFKRSLLSNQDSMNLNLAIGSNKVTLEVNIGVCESKLDGNTKEELIDNVLAAINYSSHPDYQKNYVYYREIKEKRIG